MFRKKDIILDKSKTTDTIYYLEKGFVQMFTHDEKNHKVLIHVFRPGAFFPLVPKISSWSSSRYYTFQALTPIAVYKTPSDDVVTFLHTNPEILFHTLARLTDALVGSVERLKQMNKETNERVVSLLLYLVKSFGKATNNRAIINLRLTHQDVAAWIGVSRESVSRFLSELKHKKIIKTFHGELKINDLRKLKASA